MMPHPKCAKVIHRAAIDERLLIWLGIQDDPQVLVLKHLMSVSIAIIALTDG